MANLNVEADKTADGEIDALGRRLRAGEYDVLDALEALLRAHPLVDWPAELRHPVSGMPAESYALGLTVHTVSVGSPVHEEIVVVDSRENVQVFHARPERDDATGLRALHLLTLLGVLRGEISPAQIL